MKTGKWVDVETMGKVCHTCHGINKDESEEPTAFCEAEHIGKCKTNYTGSALSMETEGVQQIFKQSEETIRQRRY